MEKKYKGNYGKWIKIAKKMPGRNKQTCKNRFLNYLKYNTKKEPWIEEEDQILLDKHKELGPKWTRITKFLPNRSASQCKDRFNLLMRRKKEKLNVNKNRSIQSAQITEQAQNNTTAAQTLIQVPAPVQTQDNTITKQQYLNNINKSINDFHNFDLDFLINLQYSENSNIDFNDPNFLYSTFNSNSSDSNIDLNQNFHQL